MAAISNVLELYKLLPKLNCGECGLPTCMAFATTVIQGKKGLDDCPHLEQNLSDQIDLTTKPPRAAAELHMGKYMEELKREIVKLDFPTVAERLGAVYADEQLTIKCLGRDYKVDREGNIASECHINPRIVVPLINYILHSPGRDPIGKWIPFTELKGELARISLFERRAELPLKQLADRHWDIFEFLLRAYGGKSVTNTFSADSCFVLHPLPKFPIMICYSRMEHGGGTKLNVFFDLVAQENLAVEDIFTIPAGLVTMFETIIFKHEGQKTPDCSLCILRPEQLQRTPCPLLRLTIGK